MGFFEKYPPAADLKEPSEHIIQACKGVGFPDEIIDFMKEHGFGNYGNGIIKVIDPEEYMRSLYTWLGQEDYSKIPIMMTGKRTGCAFPLMQVLQFPPPYSIYIKR